MKTLLNNIEPLTDQEVNIDCFFIELERLCKKYNISITHEDYHGAFILEEFDSEKMEYIKLAQVKEFAGLSNKEKKKKQLKLQSNLQMDAYKNK